MTTIVNSDPLELILTSYGLDRIAEALLDPGVTLNLGKIKVGSANGEYYTPNEGQENLVEERGEFPVIGKTLLEDKLTVSFYTIIPENFGDLDIREVGLYEVTDDGDKLFAISTQQPIVKPGTENNYYMAIDYYMFLKSANLAEIYDRIILDPNNQMITEEDLRELMTAMLFTQGNLSIQIGKNTHIIGLNRATQLYEQIQATRETLGYSAITGNFSTLSSFANSANVLGYWMFDYPRRNSDVFSITDIGAHEYNMSSGQNINLYEKDYFGIIPTLSFPTPQYYYLSPDNPLPLYNSNLGEDSPFTMMFIVAPLDTSVDRTLLAKSNYATGTHVFEVNELSSGAVEVKLFSDENNYLTFTSPTNMIKPDDIHSLVISYNKDTLSLSGYLNGSFLNFTKTETGTYTHMSNEDTPLFGFTFTPYEVIYADSDTNPANLFNADGSPYEPTHEGITWSIDNGTVYYGNDEAEYDYEKNQETPMLYYWSYNDGVDTYEIYTEDDVINEGTPLYNRDFTEYDGEDYKVMPNGEDYVIKYQNTYILERHSEDDVPPYYIFAYVAYLPDVHIWANSSTQPTVLFNEDGDVYTGSDWYLVGPNIDYKDEGYAEYDSSLDVIKSTVSACSFLIDYQGQRTQFVNSKVGIMTIALANLTNDELRICALELSAMIGKNPCIVVNE